MVVLHGAAYLGVKLEHGAVHERARRYGGAAAILCFALFAAGGAYVAFGAIGYAVQGVPDPAGASNPLRATVLAQPGAWLGNFTRHGWMLAAPALGLAGAAAAWLGLRRRGSEIAALAGSAAAAIGIISTVGLSMFPIILPSSINPHSSLLVWNASSSQHTLLLMLVSTVVLLPIVLLYTAWVYRVLWGRVTSAAVATNPDFY
jgi:cytochrome d ubiquinol oxidase subunit II